MNRMEREKKIIDWMIAFYCRKNHHHKKKPCDECKELLGYAKKRLEHCPYGGNKKSCRRCATPCYTPAMRKRIKTVMRYSGPRMIFYQPYEWIQHFFQ